MSRVLQPTSICDMCGDIVYGELNHGSACRRCEAGRYRNTAYEPERPFTEEEAARA